jgi:hypothetical protein
MKDRGFHLVVGVAVAALVGFLAWRLHDSFEKVEVDQDVGFQGEARVNPLLAVERLYSGMGLQARTLPGALDTLPPTDYALLLVSPRRAISGKRLSDLKDWVHRGGRLVVALDEAPSLDPLLSWFGVHVVTAKEKDDKEKKDRTRKADKQEDGEKVATETLEMPSRSGKVRVQVALLPRLVDERGLANFSLGSTGGQFLLRFFDGAGRVILLSDASFLTNDHIGQPDHARAAWAVVNAKEPPKGVWIVIREDLPSLAGLLARHAGAASASGLLLLVAWLWSAGARFGPIAPDPPRDRRSLLEHIEAAGDLLLRVGRGEDLVQSVREALLRRVEIREPEWSKLPPADLVARLAAVSGLTPRRVDAALCGSVDGPGDLTLAVETLEILRRAL